MNQPAPESPHNDERGTAKEVAEQADRLRNDVRRQIKQLSKCFEAMPARGMRLPQPKR